MFGEDHCQSPRVSSPWDPYLQSPPSEAKSAETSKQLRTGIPKLVPEVEEGNVEYKLKLTDISPARFARLVTQLKWRLLEGGGQAYYELGVADSGALIGLSRSDLEKSLETLEMMAGEIGASVIVVKEIEVPPAMVAFADKVSAYINPETGEWTEKMCNKRRKAPLHNMDGDYPTAFDDAETEPDLTDFTDFTDTDESFVPTPNFPPQPDTMATVSVAYAHRLIPSNPDKSLTHSSPSIYPIDDDLALFSMEPEPSFSDDVAEVDISDLDVLADVPLFSLDIEITPVYKPRPTRQAGQLNAGPGVIVGKSARGSPKNKGKVSKQAWHGLPADANPENDDSLLVPNKQDAKALLRRMARDQRREGKRKSAAMLDAVAIPRQLEAASGSPAGQPDLSAQYGSGDMAVAGLEALHARTQVANGSAAAESDTKHLYGLTSPSTAIDALEEAVVAESKEPRLIVEALVVRKMSLEDEYLDFENLGALSLSHS